MYNCEVSATISSIKPTFREVDVNHDASEFMADHYEEIVHQTRKMLKKNEEAAMDLVHDVFISIVKAENNGLGYDINKGNVSDNIKVSEFVYGRIKGYSKNAKYNQSVVQKLPGAKKGTSEGDVIASSSGGEDFENLDGFQKAFDSACTYDDLDTIEDELSVVENIKFCKEYSSTVGFDMLQVFKNIRVLSDPNVDKSLFAAFRDATRRHAEFGEAFRSIVEFSSNHAERYDCIMASL